MSETTDPHTAISLTGVEKFYGTHRALAGIDLQVRRGEKIVICGPSGSGSRR